MNEITLSEKVTAILNSRTAAHKQTKFAIALEETTEALFEAMQAESAKGTPDLFRPQAD